jgi:cytosine/adenosine deaminase-related metal-dependent hydrolase
VGAAAKVGVRVATCYGACEVDGEAERRAALEECLGFASEIGRQRDGRVRALVGVQPATLQGVERMVVEALELAGDRLSVHADLALDLTPAERWRAQHAWPTGGRPTLWAHAEAAPRGLLAEARDRGDHLSAVGAGALTALLRDTELAWGSDAGVLAPPLPDTQQAWSFAASAEAHYQRLFVHGARWAEGEFGEGIGAIAPGAPADLVLVDYRPATEFSQRTLLDHLWSGILRARVSGVMVAGEVVMDNGTLVHLDEQEVAARAREAAARVWARL